MVVWKTWSGLIIPLTLALGFALLAKQIMTWSAPEGPPQLTPPSENQDVYVLGNSMFGTGLDLKHLRVLRPEDQIDFGYYNGHYTSMWHLAVSVSMPRETAPNIVVWGFRPTYAITPAFRQNKQTAEQDFVHLAPPAYHHVHANAGDPIAKLRDTEAYTLVDDNLFQGSASPEPFEYAGAFIAHQLNQFILSDDDEFGQTLQKRSAQSLMQLFQIWDSPTSETAQAPRASDLLISYVTEGQITRADALVIDNGERFIRGKRVTFDESFIPLITEQLRRNGSRQLVILFKPASMLGGRIDPDVRAFYDAAIEHFDQNAIAYIDLIGDPEMKNKFYAKGDHFNAKGALYVTERINQALDQF